MTRISYARSDGADLAYFTLGSGQHDILLSSWMIPIDAMLEDPGVRRLLDRLAGFARLICFDRRGFGLSDPVSRTEPPTLEQDARDMGVVLDAARAQRACVLSVDPSTTGPAVLFAAENPERVSHLVLFNPMARARWAEDHEWGIPNDAIEHELDTMELELRTGEAFGFFRAQPTLAADDEALERWAHYARRGMSPQTCRLFLQQLFDIDVRSVLPAVQSPTLVLVRAEMEESWRRRAAYVVEHLPGARSADVPGGDILLWLGDTDAVADEIETWLTGSDGSKQTDRTFATVLFTDIVASTERTASLGDAAWRGVLDQHERIVRSAIGRFRGRFIHSTGDGLLATFDGPARAIRCAVEIRDELRGLDLTIRAGLHAGEIITRGGEVSGIAVNIASRVSAIAGAGQILVSRTLNELVSGSGIAFEDVGEHQLKGLEGDWRFFAVCP